MFSIFPNNQHQHEASRQSPYLTGQSCSPYYNDQLDSRSQTTVQPMAWQHGEQTYMSYPAIQSPTPAYIAQYHHHGYGYTPQFLQTPIIQHDQRSIPETQSGQRLIIQGSQIYHATQGIPRQTEMYRYASFPTYIATGLDQSIQSNCNINKVHLSDYNVWSGELLRDKGNENQYPKTVQSEQNVTDDGKQANILYRALKLKMQGILSAKSELLSPGSPQSKSSPRNDVVNVNSSCIETARDVCSGKNEIIVIEHSPKKEEIPVPSSMAVDQALALGLVPTCAINKPTVWLNVTLQMDTSTRMKNGQPTTQYRSLITNIVTRLVYPSNVCPLEDTDMVNASVTYDERGRIFVIEVDFVTAGIFHVISDTKSKPHPTFSRSSLKAVILKRVKSIDNLEPGSQYVILGELCSVPRGVQKCYRNAKPLCRKLMEYIYTQEFRKYTLSLLIDNGEKDIWTDGLKTPRTRSRVLDYGDLAMGQQTRKRKSLSPTPKDSTPQGVRNDDGSDLHNKSRRRSRKPRHSPHLPSPSSSPLSESLSTSSSPSHNSNPTSPEHISPLLPSCTVTSRASEAPQDTWFPPSQTSSSTSPAWIDPRIPPVYSPISPPVLTNEGTYELSYTDNIHLSPPVLEPVVIDYSYKSSKTSQTSECTDSFGQTAISDYSNNYGQTVTVDYTKRSEQVTAIDYTKRFEPTGAVDYTKQFERTAAIGYFNIFEQDAAIDYSNRSERDAAIGPIGLERVEAIDDTNRFERTAATYYNNGSDQVAAIDYTLPNRSQRVAAIDYTNRSGRLVAIDYTNIPGRLAAIDYTNGSERLAAIDYANISEGVDAMDYTNRSERVAVTDNGETAASDYTGKPGFLERTFDYASGRTEWTLENCTCGCNSY